MKRLVVSAIALAIVLSTPVAAQTHERRPRRASAPM